MSIRVYNTLTNQKEPFEPLQPGKVGMYVCGPTVYKNSHIGHAVGPVIFDAIKRYLTSSGFDVTLVINVTDVEDKIIAESLAQGRPPFALAEEVTDNYLKAIDQLDAREGINHLPKVSTHMDDIIKLIERIIERGFGYEVDGDIYFDVAKDREYGKLSNRRSEEQFCQRELESGQKHNPGDFVLWKAAKPDEPEEVKFDSPWGKGRPGWHIECSAMSMRYLGESFDIHGGGMDLIFPHHENEIAQAECGTGKPFAKYWMHNGLTRFNTKKISKSDADMAAALEKMTLSTLLDEYGGELLRFFILGTHYRRPIDFSDEEMEAKRKGLATFHRLFERVERMTGQSPHENVEPSTETLQSLASVSDEARQLIDEVGQHRERYTQAMDDDFNTAAAIAAMFDLASRINRYIDTQKLEGGKDDKQQAVALESARQLVALGRLIGLFLHPPQSAVAGDDTGLLDDVMHVLIDVRAHCRKNKDFVAADMIRNRLGEIKITLEDRPDGTIWRHGD
ncbi:MAG: cysteine--tRNA ligase [Phycisphaerae bacterium]|nr:cysteine--tRNA ligase [Phycisphaerae bacterium]